VTLRDRRFESLTDIPALREAEITAGEAIDPVRGDPLARVFVRIAGLRPLHVAVLVLVAQYGTILLALLATTELGWTAPVDQTLGKESLEHINLAILVPIGAALLCHLYRQIRATFSEIQRRGIVVATDRGKCEDIRAWTQRAYDARIPVMACLALSGLLNGWFLGTGAELFGQTLELGSPNVAATVVLLYARLWVCANYFLIFLLFYRSAVTALALYRITSLGLNVEPLHPDRAGGLGSLGALSMAVTYFLSLVMVFFALVAMFAETDQSLIYLSLLCAFALLTVTAFLASLSPAHGTMRRVKADALLRMEVLARRLYKRFLAYSTTGGEEVDPDRDLIEEINAVDQLYGVVQKMPVWPFDFTIAGRVATSVAVPVAIFLFERFDGFQKIQSVMDYLSKTFLA